MRSAQKIIDEIRRLQKDARFKILQARMAINRKDYQLACSVLEDAKSTFPAGLGPMVVRMMQAEIGFLLGRVYDKLGDYDSAWQAAADAHVAKPEAFDVDRLEDQATRIMDFFTRERIQQMTQASEQPVEPLLVMATHEVARHFSTRFWACILKSF